jgi:alkanesulfonate monooxygenase SsuD/methylene tetrahydromethanopterin reductase-like flavin-dependent oxidoreductase (luciferase family)/FAD/FMN-containing dehydrogenase
MPDYGHPLTFGAFITPTHGQRPGSDHGPAALAVRAEEHGLELVTVQDHPYQPSFYDTWTLLSWVAARTDRIGLSGNVLNLPLRQPAVLARAVASLDLLTGGRVRLGLGAGAFWEAIEAMGGPRRSGGESVSALAEAIEVIREVWDAAARGGVRVDGEFYRVHGAKRGPAPAHPIPIWLGAYKPRMLRLTARLADGWLPSLSYLKPGDLARGNAVIDEAAGKAGRDPREITRLLNVGADADPGDLARLAREDGISVFIAALDDERAIHRFASEIAPRVKDLVAAGREKAALVTGAPPRSSAAKSRRLPGIEYDAVPAVLASAVVEPGDPAYAKYTSSYLRGGAPGIVLRARNSEEVAAAVGFAARHRDVPLGIYSAGHGLSGRSLNHGGVVIDVSAINHIDVEDAAAGLVRIGPGARWMDVARALAPHRLAITSGDYGGVGVGGLATAGGVGMFARQHGLTIDLLRSVQVVLADGTVTRASADVEPDLFWAVRGAGANVGVVTDFEFAAPTVGEVGFAQFVFDATDAAGFLEKWGQAMEAAPREVSGEIMLSSGRPGSAGYAQALLLVNRADPDGVIAALEPIARIAPLVDQQVAMTTYDQVLSAYFHDAPHSAQGEPRSHSGLARHLIRELSLEAAAMLQAGASPFFQIRSVGGAVSDVPADATAYGWRDANFAISAFGTRHSELDSWWRRLEPHLEGLYLSFETDTGPEALAKAFPPSTLERLRDVKRRYDPTGLFRDNFYVPPGPPHAEGD